LSFEELAKRLKKPVKAMTLLSAEFGKGISIYHSNLSCEDEFLVESVLSCFGDVVKGDERDVDMLTAFSSSVAFLSKIYEAFIYSALRLGFNIELAKRIALNVFEGSVELLKFYESNEVVERVTTPAGITIEGLCSLLKHGVEFGVIEAITTSAKRLEGI
jgi:pyrroline-5-carboxylate reductase